MVWLGAYILIAGVGNFVLLRKLGRREWGWITLPSISIVFASAMYFSTAANRPHELRGDDIAIYWMDEKSPVAFIERGDRVSSNRRQTVAVTTNTDEILAGDRNNTGQALTVNMFGQQDVNPFNQWDVTIDRSTTVGLRMLQWSFQDIEFVGPETEPGTVRRVDDTRFRNETGRNFRQGMYVDAANVYFFSAIPNGSQFDLAAAIATKSLRQATSCRPCAMMGFPSELANFNYNQANPRNQADNETPDPDAAQMLSVILGLATKPFDLSELIRA